MNANISDTNLAIFSAACKQLNKAWVRSHLEIEGLAHIKSSKFAVLIPDFHNNQIIVKGSLTWGASGFSFSVTTKLQAQIPPILTIHIHNYCDLTAETIEEIIGDLIEMANNKVLGSTNSFRAEYRAPRLKAMNRSNKISLKSRENIARFEKNSVFDREFSNFILRHEQDGIRCDGSRKN